MTTTDEVEQHLNLHEPGWSQSYAVFPQVLREHGCKVGVEVGVAFGGHSEAMLNQCDLTKLYGVDSYKHREGYEDQMNLSQAVFDALHERTVKRLSTYGSRFELLRLESAEAAAALKEELDFVYLDADHSYEGVFRDLRAWFSKVRPGGIIGGHDYGHPQFPGVKQAVDEFFRRFDWQVTVEDSRIWWVQTQPVHISFIMPAFDCAKTIASSIASILDGNLQGDDEIVVVDDGSTDGTVEVVRQLAASHPMIRLVSHPRNKGGGAARNTAVEHARHSLLFCLDSDNLLSANSVPSLKSFLVNTGADVACFESINYFETTPEHLTHVWKIRTGLFTFADVLRSTIVPGASGNYLFSKESWKRSKGYPEATGALDTWGFGFRQLAVGARMMVQPLSGYFHRQGHDSYWVRQERQSNISLLALQIVLPFISRLDPRDVNYIMGPRGRLCWFNRVDKRPLRLKRDEPKHRAQAKHLYRRCRTFVKRLFNRD